MASTMPGTMPAMNSCARADVLVDSTGGDCVHHHHDRRRDQDAERAAGRDHAGAEALGKPCLTIAGSRIEPIATTVAGLEPDTAANSAQAMTPASPSPPCQWPTIDVAKRSSAARRRRGSGSCRRG